MDPPTARIVFPLGVNDSVVDITDSLKFSASFSDNVGVDNFTVRVTAIGPVLLPTGIDLVLDTNLTTPVLSIARPFTITLPSNAAGQRIAIAVTATDPAGNVASDTVTAVINDPSPPVMTVLSPASGAIVPAGDTIRVIVRGFDASGLDTMGARLFQTRDILGRPRTITEARRTYAAGTTIRTDTFRVFVPDTLDPGSYFVQAFASDRSPNANDTSTADIAITVADTTRPTGAFTPPLNGANRTAGDSILVSVRVRDSAGVASITLAGASHRGVDSLGTGTNPPRYSPKTTTFSGRRPSDTTITRFLNAILSDSTPERVYIEATITDVGGNVRTVRDSITVVAGPTVSVFSPLAGSVHPVGVPLNIVVDAYDPDGVQIAGFLARGAVVGAESTVFAGAVANRTANVSLALPATSSLGVDTITPFATDVLGNRFLGQRIIVTLVDTLRPTITILAPTLDSGVVAGDSVKIRVRVQDNRGVTGVTLLGRSARPGGPDSLGNVQTTTRYASKSVSLAQHTDTTVVRYLNAVPDSLAEPVYLVVTAQDQSGNSFSDSLRVQVTAGPFVRTTAPLAGSRQPAGVPLSVTINGFDPDNLVYLGFTATGVTAAADSIAIAPLATNATRTLILNTLSTTPDGDETIVPFARDGFGNRFTGPPITVQYTDTVRPTVTIALPAAPNFPVTVGDSVLVRVRVQDNRGVASATLSGIAHRGVDSLGSGSNVVRYTPKVATLSLHTDTTFSRYLLANPADSSSEFVNLIVDAVDAAGNHGLDSIAVRIVRGPTVTVARPAVGTTTSPGKSIIVEVRANDADGVRLLGYRVTGVHAENDSIFRAPVAGTLPDTATFIDTLAIPGATALGSITITPFAVDSLGDPSGTVTGIPVTVASSASDVTPPTVLFSIGRRIETDDSVNVSATDAGGITRVGWTVNILGGALIASDSTTPALAGTLSDVSQVFSLNLPGAPVLRFPAQVVVSAFAYDLLGNRGTSAAETLTVVAGKTYALPAGSHIGDAIYDANRQELLLANTTYDRLEVFSLASRTFVASIPIGSRPVGIALWPRDTLGNYADTVIVANSGGTNLSIVDLVSRQEVRRHRLPSFLVHTVKTALNGGGGVSVVYTEWDFSDRPFHVGALCIASTSANCDYVRALYSTSPTNAQVTPFPNRGYLAWSDLNPGAFPGPHNHLVYEHVSDIAGVSDSLEIIARYDSVFGQVATDTILGAGVGIRVDPATLSFQDSTFVRNSGDFLTGVVGEGGTVNFARAIRYDARRPLTTYTVPGSCIIPLTTVQLNCTATRDAAVADVALVGDFVVNRAARVTGIATNYNGLTSFVRADSIYVFDQVLRQTGMMQVSGASVGMDPHPSNNFDAARRGTGGLGGFGNVNNRLLFAARPDSSIEVFDTYFYGRVTDTTVTASTIPVPIRNGLIGPVRVADVAGSTTLFGVTAHGLVVVTLPSVSNSLFPIMGQPIVTQPPIAPTPRAAPRTRAVAPPRTQR